MRTDAYHILVDLRGSVLASDWTLPGGAARPQSLDQIVEPIAASALLQEVATATVVEGYTAKMSVPLAGHATCNIHVRRLVGSGGPLALLLLSLGDEEPAVCDALTGLPDRRAIASRVSAWQAAAGLHASYAVLFVDLDGFKQINDAHGHAVGDQVLVEVAARLARCVRDRDLVVRYGGDEFVVLLKDIDCRDSLLPVIERIRQGVSRPIVTNSNEFVVGLTIGASIVDRGSVSVEEAIEAADQDMFRQKRTSDE